MTVQHPRPGCACDRCLGFRGAALIARAPVLSAAAVGDRDRRAERAGPRRHAHRIVERVAYHQGVAVAAIIGTSRRQADVVSRAIAAWLVRRIDRLSLVQTALVVGRTDAPAAITLIARAEQLRDTDPAARRVMDRILGEEE